MKHEPIKTDPLPADLNSLRSTVACSESLLQFDLLDCLRLQQFASARGVRLFGADAILNLWKSGILRADVVWSPSSDNPFQLPTIKKRGGGFLYSDTRHASPQIRRNFFGQLGLDASIKVRCYVEGATEHGAYASAFSEFGSIEFIDLAGRFVQSGGKGLAFAQSLKNDKAHHIFSAVCLDADRGDNLRTLRKS